MDTRRGFLATLGAGWLGTSLANGQTPAPQQGSAFLRERSRTTQPPPLVRKIKTTTLFKSPEGYPNGIAVAPEGLWICEQKSDNAVLVDWKGKLLKTLKSQSKNTSGIAYGDGCVWMAGNSAAAEGVFQIDMNGRELTHRQIPLGPADNGGGCHGIEYVDGKIYIAALRLRGILRVDAKTWQPEFMIPYAVPRAHGIAHNPADGSVWMVTGTSGWPGRADPVRQHHGSRAVDRGVRQDRLRSSRTRVARRRAVQQRRRHPSRDGRTTSARRTATSSRSTSSSSSG